MNRTISTLVAFAACAPDLSGELDPGPAPSLPPDGVLIDATSETEEVGYDLDAGVVVDVADPTWDLSFLRYFVRLNGGVSGPGTVEAAVLPGVAYDDVAVAPETGFTTDTPDANGDGIDELVLGGWYVYDLVAHTLAPAEVVYVVRSTEGADHKLAFLSYYDQAGTPAMITFVTSPLEAP
jgi:hypothetical protein